MVITVTWAFKRRKEVFKAAQQIPCKKKKKKDYFRSTSAARKWSPVLPRRLERQEDYLVPLRQSGDDAAGLGQPQPRGEGATAV